MSEAAGFVIWFTIAIAWLSPRSVGRWLAEVRRAYDAKMDEAP